MEAEPCDGSMFCCTPATRLLTVVFMLLLVVAILLGNLLTLTVILGSSSSSRPRLHTPQSYLKASLAAADLAVGVLVVPLSVYAEASPLLGLPQPAWTSSSSSSGRGLHPCSLVGPVFAGCTLVSISTVFLLSLERAVALLRPLHRDWLVTRRRTVLLVVLSWLGSFSLAVAPLLFGGDIVLEYNSCSHMCTYVLGRGERTSSQSSGRTWNILLLFPAFDFTLLAATLLVNIISFSSIRQHSRRRRHLAHAQGPASSSSSTAKPTFSDIKAARTIGALTVAFTASFTPIAIFVVGNVLGHEWCNFSFLAFWILASNSCWNVIIYSVRDHRFRMKAHRLLWPLNRRNSSHN